jgi:hypothetical protein
VGYELTNDSMLTRHEVDDDEIPKKYYFIQQLSKGQISKLHNFFSSLFLTKCMKHLVLYTMNICNIPMNVG